YGPNRNRERRPCVLQPATRSVTARLENGSHRPRRIALRPRHLRRNRQRGSACCEMQKLPSVGKFHFEPPFTSFDHLVGGGGSLRIHDHMEGQIFAFYDALYSRLPCSQASSIVRPRQTAYSPRFNMSGSFAMLEATRLASSIAICFASMASA